MSKSIARRLAIQRGARIDQDAQYRTEEATGPVLAHLAGGLPALEKYCATQARCIGEAIDRERGTMTQQWAHPFATVTVPARTVSELNRHEHWRHRQKRAKAQHEAVLLPLHCMADMPRIKLKLMTHDGPVHVHLTRLATRKLDTDNLAGSLKHVRDAVAKFLGVDDGDESKVTWSVNQEQQKGYAVRIEFYRRQV